MNSKTKAIMKKVSLGMAVLSVGILLGIVVQPIISNDNVYDQFRKYQFVLNTAMKNYVEDVDAKKLTEAAIKGMLGELDVHSVYINEEELKGVQENFQGGFEGIGVEFDIIDDTITVVTPLAGGPSEELGVESGDKIVKIDGENAVGIARGEVPKKLKGPKGTHVLIEVKRTGEKNLLTFDIERDRIPIETVDASYMIDNSDIGYISINRFAQTTHEEMMKAAARLKSEGMTKLILDLRDNPGGYLTQAFYMADEFLPGSQKIVYTKGRRAEFDEMYESSAGGALENIPLIVMVNEGSASASEIVSGAIQDLDRGLVVGTTSYGKGLVQRQYDIGDGSAFRLTISYYYTPSGRSIQRPFKDKEAYRKLVGRLELEEGANLEHSIDKILKEKDKDGKKIDKDSLPIFYTKKGRMVLGGGGITPDYIVKQDTSKASDLFTDLFRKRIVNEFAISYLNSSAGKQLKAKYEKDFDSYMKNFKITDDILSEVKSIAKTKEVEWKDEDFQKDKIYILTHLKANLARIIWDRNKYNQVMSDVDKQLKLAKTLFPEAAKISSLK